MKSGGVIFKVPPDIRSMTSKVNDAASMIWMDSVFNKFRFVDDHIYIHTSYNNSCNYQLERRSVRLWKTALNKIAVEKWKAKLEEIETLAMAKSSELPEIATNLPRKTILFVSAIALKKCTQTKEK